MGKCTAVWAATCRRSHDREFRRLLFTTVAQGRDNGRIETMASDIVQEAQTQTIHLGRQAGLNLWISTSWSLTATD